MKRILVIILTLALILSLTACGSSDQEEPVEDNKPTESAVQTGDSNILIAYFSRTGNIENESDTDAVSSATFNDQNGELAGNTQIVAEYVQENTSGEIFPVTVTEKYPIDYDENVNVATEEQENDARPELSSKVENMDQYDTVYIGYPIWWGTMPQAMFTFLEAYDFSGKTIIPFCTHGGSGLSRSVDDIKELCPDSNILTGLAVSGSSATDSKADVDTWIADSEKE